MGKQKVQGIDYIHISHIYGFFDMCYSFLCILGVLYSPNAQMYGIFTYIYHKQLHCFVRFFNAIHGAYGLEYHQFLHKWVGSQPSPNYPISYHVAD